MATRRDIRDVFYSELSTYAATSHTVTYGDGSTDTITVAADDIDLIGPNTVESRPAVIYDDDYITRDYNGVGKGPHSKTRDMNDDVTAEVWREYVTAVFTVRIEADNEIEKEPIYEAVRSGFKKWNLGGWDERSLNADISNIDVGDADSSDYLDEDDTIRVDDIVVFIDFHRDFELTGDNIDVVDLTTDADTDDGTAGNNFTIN